jgi:hypothetical protein
LRIQKARDIFVRMSNIWRANYLSIKIKLRISNACIKSVLLYGCKTNTAIIIYPESVKECLHKFTFRKQEEMLLFFGRDFLILKMKNGTHTILKCS